MISPTPDSAAANDPFSASEERMDVLFQGARQSNSSSSSTESKRLAALSHYDILDTSTEERFDRITRLARRLLDVPIALITFLDEDRQWFKSCVGLSLTETTREVSFCAHNLDGDDLLVVEDATEDPRFADNPLVTEAPGIRFYVGAPLVTPDGHVLGSLCVIDTKPRSAKAMDLGALRDLAEIVVTELELRAANADLRTRNQQVQTLTRDLKTAQEEERSQLSELLHEELQQVLQAARMTLENVRNHEGLSDPLIQRFDRVKASLDDALGVTRALSARFAPPVGNQPLRDTLEWLAQKMRESHGLSVSILGRGAAPVGDEALQTLLYLLVREVLFRVVRAEKADTASVHLIESAGRLRVSVQDEGEEAGILDDLTEQDSSLSRLCSQLEALGGGLEVRTHPGVGTCVTIEIPQSK